MVVMAPKDENELQHMIYTGIQHNGPAAIRYPRGSGVGVGLDWQLSEIPIGKAQMEKDGSDLALVAIGHHVQTAIAAADRLEKEKGIHAAVINARFAKPIDVDMMVKVARKTNRIITIEENALAGGFGSAVLESLADAGIIQIKVKRLGLPDRFIEQGSQILLRQDANLDVASVIEAAMELVNFNRSEQPVIANVRSINA